MLLRVRLGLMLSVALVLAAQARASETPKNMFGNAGFERGQAGWRMDKGGKTAARFSLDKQSAAAGDYGMLVTIDAVESWGTQFGQTIPAGQKGKTYTFAVLAKSAGAPVKVDLQIERAGKPYDRAARSKNLTLTKDKWTELHVTFKVAKDFPQGWFAYISCKQPRCRYRADVFRLYEGDYVPYKEVEQREAAAAGVRLFDTGTSSGAALSAEALSRRRGWTQVPEDDVEHRFRGDAVLLNNRLAVALRRKGRGAEVYSLGRAGPKLRARLTPVGAARLSSLKIAENSPSGVALDATFKAASGKAIALRYELGMGQVFVKTEPRAGVAALRVEAPCRFAVMPDFFADDIVLDAAELPVARAAVPSDHFLLHMLGRGEAVVMIVWNPRGEDIRIRLSGQGKRRTIDSSQITYGEKGKVWVAVLEGQGTWHTHKVAGSDAGKIIRLGWERPFPAQWRVDWRRDDGLTDSWEMVAEQSDGRFVKRGWFGSPSRLPTSRKRWTTVLGRFLYPCWVDRRGRGCLQPLRSKVLRFQGPALIYPINRARETPLDRFTVVDIVRATLGVGPCEYILDVEGQRSRSRGRATCAVRDTLNRIYARKQQKRRRAEVERALVDVMAFIEFIRGRINGYVDFGHKLLNYLAEQERARPELAKHLAELEKLTRAIDQRVANRKDTIKTPAEAGRMVERFRTTMLDYEGADALAKCKRFTKAIVSIGGSQDELVGECRWAVKVVRQRAGLLMAVDPRMAEVAREIRRRSQKVLRNPAGHEGARH